MSNPHSSNNKKSFNIIEDRIIQQENKRLMKRLNEIGRRKNSYSKKEYGDDDSYYTIQIKSK